ncbi:Muramidase (phage lambda lysozyme) [Chryseobacterium taeanense]|uniref:Muramidase (Phage lambda lysozyme) n=1 Tax=Chryseobacterium taeanense TaxID=311334 RepID=A0A1G8LF80_9FLAO|nr:peptidoglycan DD-metalloendopeptidase family protein [Chryseobacterium taeanense]SDI54321.1 Muramidase (phage lambda lysozyme) [Chryseobacterium taeanense]
MRDDTPIKENTVLKYGQSIKVKVYTQNMPGEKIKLSLYEDDVNGSGHSAKNEKNKVASITRNLNKDGFLWHEFKLPVEFSKIANAVMDGSQDKIHEYYVVAETAQHKSVSKNAEVKNPDYIFTQTVSSTIGPNKIYGKEILIEEVVIKGKYKKQVGVDAMEKSGRSMVGVKAPPAVKQDDKNEVCECEARVRAFMRMLRYKEGTDKDIGYTTQYSGKQFSDMSKHPEKVITAGKYSSSAAGAYQIMTDTWKNLTGYYKDENKKWHYSEKIDYAKKYNITSFDQESQDKFCLVIMKHNYVKDRSDSFYNPTIWKDKKKHIRDTEKEEKIKEWRKRFKGQQGDIIQMIIDNDIKRAALISSLCWASLPDSPYGQQQLGYTFAIVKAIYENYLREELNETQTWNLYLKKGFLKEFGYGCCQNNIDNQNQDANNKCMKDYSQCLEYVDVVETPKINNQSNDVNKNRFHRKMRYNKSHPEGYYHTGTDILASLNTPLKSMLCGEVTDAYDTKGDLGVIVTVKSKDKAGKFIWIRYCHLSSIKVSKGDKTKHGTVVGLSGNTGNAKNILPQYYHVHIEASRDGVFYRGKNRVDPEEFMKTKFDETTKGNPIK